MLTLGTYTERSPSKRGLHAFIEATIPRQWKISARNCNPGLEIYDGRQGSARYFTVTGGRVGRLSEIRKGPEAQAALDAFIAKWVPDHAEAVEVPEKIQSDEQKLDDDAALHVMFDATDGAKYRRIFQGDRTGYSSQSEADYALCRKLRFYTRADATQMDRLFRRSGLIRSKWDEKRGTGTYGSTTIANAMRDAGRLYSLSHPRYSAEPSVGQFGKVHRLILPILARLTKTDNLVYEALAVHANRNTGACWASATTIGRLIGKTREHVQESIGNLKAAGLISVTPRSGTTSIIRLLAYQGVSKLDTCTGKQPQKALARRNGTTRRLDPDGKNCSPLP